jgi:thiol peroxidase
VTRLTLKGTPVYTEGHLPVVGHEAPRFTLTGKDLVDVGLEQFGMQRKLLSIVPSLEMPTCAASLRRFNDHARQAPGTVVLSISHDLPFATQSRIDTTCDPGDRRQGTEAQRLRGDPRSAAWTSRGPATSRWSS